MRSDKIRYFHQEADAQVTEYEVLSTASPCEVLKEIAISVGATGDFLIGKWISEALSAQTIPAGTWTFYLWCYRTDGAVNIYAKVYRWSAGVETLLCESTKGTVPKDAYTEVTVTASFPETAFADGDKIVVELRFEVVTAKKGKKACFGCDTTAYNSRVDTTEVVIIEKHVSDSGTGLDVATVSLAEHIVSDSGIGSETISLEASIPMIESGFGADSPLVTALIPISEIAVGTDEVSVTKPVMCYDCGGSTTELTHPTLGCMCYYCSTCDIYWILGGVLT